MRLLLLIFIVLCSAMPDGCGQAGKSSISSHSENEAIANNNLFPEQHWEKADETQKRNWSSQKLKLARKYSASLDTDALLIIENGLVIDEWGDTSARFNVNSVRKCILSVLYGLAVDEGKINLNSTLEELGIDDNEPALTKEEKRARVSDLLKARSGIYHPAAYESDGVKANRPRRGSHPPGTFLYYNNWDFNALGTIFNKAVNASLFEVFKNRVAEPLQMEDFRLEDTEYFRESDSIHPAYLFRLSARGLARFGWLVLNQGKWKDKQIVSKKWVTESTTAHSDAGNSGYGYMWWVAVNGRLIPNVQLGVGAISCSGYGGQWLVIIPDKKLVIVHLVNAEDTDGSVSGEQFGKLLSLILDAKSEQPRSQPGCDLMEQTPPAHG